MSCTEQELHRKKVQKALKKYAKHEPWRSYNNNEALECTVCASILSHKRSTMLDHLSGEKHKKAQQEHQRAVQQHKSIVTMIEDSPFPERTNLTPDQYARRAGPLEAVLATNKTVSTIQELSEFLAPQYAVLATSRVADFIPFLRDAHMRRIVSTLKDKPVVIIFDGTQEQAEVFAIIVRYVNEILEPKQMLVRLRFYAHSWTKENLAHELAELLFGKPDDEERAGIGLSRKSILAFVCDGGSINEPGINILKGRCSEFADAPIILCIDHFFDNLGKKFNPMELDRFTSAIISLFQSLKARFLWAKFGEEFYDMLLGAVPRPNRVRWWSKFKLYKYILQHESMLEQFILETDYDWQVPVAMMDLRAVLNDAVLWAATRIQLALVVDVFEMFVTASALLEGDSLTILFAYDQICALRLHLLENNARPTVRKISEQLQEARIKRTNKILLKDIASDWITYASELLSGVREYFLDAEKPGGRLSKMSMMAAARLLDPSRAMELFCISEQNFDIALSKDLQELALPKTLVCTK